LHIRDNTGIDEGEGFVLAKEGHFREEREVYRFSDGTLRAGLETVLRMRVFASRSQILCLLLISSEAVRKTLLTVQSYQNSIY